MEALNEIGIYRLSGATSTIQSLRAQFETLGDVDLEADHTDPNAVASLLKAFVRECIIQ
jgi:hypothetical protein